jgi:hypothetical protein
MKLMRLERRATIELRSDLYWVNVSKRGMRGLFSIFGPTPH